MPSVVRFAQLPDEEAAFIDGATVRNIFTGHSGYMGLTAARLVECGFTGEVDGVGNVYGKVLSDTFDRERVVVSSDGVAQRAPIRRGDR